MPGWERLLLSACLLAVFSVLFRLPVTAKKVLKAALISTDEVCRLFDGSIVFGVRLWLEDWIDSNDEGIVAEPVGKDGDVALSRDMHVPWTDTYTVVRCRVEPKRPPTEKIGVDSDVDVSLAEKVMLTREVLNCVFVHVRVVVVCTL